MADAGEELPDDSAARPLAANAPIASLSRERIRDLLRVRHLPLHGTREQCGQRLMEALADAGEELPAKRGGFEPELLPLLTSGMNTSVEAWAARSIERAHMRAERNEPEAELNLSQYLKTFPALRRKLKPFQLEGVKFGLLQEGRCLIADEMGLGKTFQALILAQQFSDEWPMLVVAPAVAALNWQAEVEKWLPHLGRNVQVLSKGREEIDPEALIVILSYDLLTRHGMYRRRADGNPYEVIILDEAHSMKTPSTSRARAILPLCQHARRCVLLTGTPIMNCAAESWSLLAALDGSIPPFSLFCERYSKKNTRNGVTRLVGVRNPEELHGVLRGSMIRRKKDEGRITLLKEKTRQVFAIPEDQLDAKWAKRIRGLKKNMADNDKYAAMVFSITAKAKLDVVVRYVEGLLLDREKIVVFAHHSVMLNAMEMKLRELGLSFIRIDGRTSKPLRDVYIKQFQEDEKVSAALVSITAGGQAISLTAARTVVFAELHWVPARLLQAEDRVHRPGQDDEVEIHYCVADADPYLDQSILSKIIDKERIMDLVVEGAEGEGHFAQLVGTRQPSANSGRPR